MKTFRRIASIGALMAALGVPGALMADSAGASSTTNSTWTAPARAARKQNPIPADAASIAKGKELYEDACISCHGAAGKGDGSSAAALERKGARIRSGNLSDPKLWLETDGELFWKITEGNRPMPSWGAKLTEEERWLIINYVRTLAPKPQTNAKSGDNP